MSIHLNISWVRATNQWGIDLNMRREIPYLQATMYYFVYYIISIGFSWQENSTKDLELRIVNALPFICQTDREVQKVSNVKAADWQYQTQIKNFPNLCIFSRLEILFKHCNLYTKHKYCTVYLSFIISLVWCCLLFLLVFWSLLINIYSINEGNISTMKFFKIIQIVRAFRLAIKPFYMSICKHGFCSSFISYFIKEM